MSLDTMEKISLFILMFICAFYAVWIGQEVWSLL